MSFENKIRAAATAAAQEAMLTERARCLWCIDSVIAELEAGVSKKLMTPAQTQGAKIKIQIARGLGMKVRAVIASGVRPVARGGAGVTGQTGAAGSFPPEGTGHG